MNDGWITVGERLPERDVLVLIYSDSKYGVSMGTYDADGWHDCFGNSAGRVTHWQPLPDPPK